jgi:hypothetical protein
MNTIDERVKNAKFAVDANSFEQMSLWLENKERYNIVQDLRGLCYVIGNVVINDEEMPVVIELSFWTIDGMIVMFYHPCSQVVDYRIVEKWLDDNTKCPRTNAMNFDNIQNIFEK